MNNALGRVLPQYAVKHGVCKDASQADKQIPYIHLAPAPIPSAVARGKSGWAWMHPPVQLCLPELDCWSWASKCSYSRMVYKTMWGHSYHQNKIHSLAKESVLSLAFLLSARLTPSCSWASLLFMPDGSSVPNYNCWAVTIRISPWELNAKCKLFLNILCTSRLGPSLLSFPVSPVHHPPVPLTWQESALICKWFTPPHFPQTRAGKESTGPLSRFLALHERG